MLIDVRDSHPAHLNRTPDPVLEIRGELTDQAKHLGTHGALAQDGDSDRLADALARVVAVAFNCRSVFEAHSIPYVSFGLRLFRSFRHCGATCVSGLARQCTALSSSRLHLAGRVPRRVKNASPFFTDQGFCTDDEE